MKQNTFIINSQHERWLNKMGMASFDQLMHDDLGDLVELPVGREIRRISGFGQAAYLKRQYSYSLVKSLELCFLGCWPYTSLFNEYRHVCSLKQHGLAVMNVVAVGEQRRMGFPHCGFILLEEVKGTRLDLAYQQADNEDQKEQMLEAYGLLLAELHARGFYTPLRLKDIIMTENKGEPFVMIDRETRYPFPRCRLSFHRKRSLKRAFIRMERSNSLLTTSNIQIITKIYKERLTDLLGARVWF
jgi:hypothetical protein